MTLTLLIHARAISARASPVTPLRLADICRLKLRLESLLKIILETLPLAVESTRKIAHEEIKSPLASHAICAPQARAISPT